jgi:hypothetical protein
MGENGKRWAPTSWLLGIALSAAVVIGCAVVREAVAPPTLAIVGLGVLAVAGTVAGAVAPRLPGKLIVGMVLAAPGAGLVALSGRFDHPWWLGATAAAAIVVAAPLVADADRRWGRWGSEKGGTPVAFAIASVGVFACVPDTEEAWVLLVVAVVAAVISVVTPWRTLGASGSFACTGVLVWVAAFDARGRPAAVIGAVTALGLLVWEPIGARLRGARLGKHRVHSRVALVLAHAALAAYASRVVGLERSVWSAVAFAVPAVVVGITVGALVGARSGSP